MARNGNRITNYYNNIEARVDWQKQVNRAWDMGQQHLLGPIMRKHKINNVPTETWRRLDKATGDIRQALDTIEQERKAVSHG